MIAQWSFACTDWQDRIRTGGSLLPHLPLLDENRAAKAKLVFDRLHLPDVHGQPLMRDAAGDWFRDIVGALHGSIGQDGRRHIREPL